MRGLVGFVLLLAACSSTSTNAAATDAGAASGGGKCTAARDQLLGPVAKVSDAVVQVVSESAGKITVYVDASAGGFDQIRKNPRVYITLDGQRVDVSDTDAPTSTAWDLSLKRQVIFTNSGDTGAGAGGGVLVTKPFASTTADDGAAVAPEALFDADCNAITDQIQDPQTSFTGWYDYDIAVMRASPRANVSFVVRNAAGTDLYVVGIRSYTGRPDGTTTAPATGFYLLDIRKL